MPSQWFRKELTTKQAWIDAVCASSFTLRGRVQRDDDDQAPERRELLVAQLRRRTRAVRAHWTRRYTLKLARFKSRMRVLLPPGSLDAAPLQPPPHTSLG